MRFWGFLVVLGGLTIGGTAYADPWSEPAREGATPAPDWIDAEEFDAREAPRRSPGYVPRSRGDDDDSADFEATLHDSEVADQLQVVENRIADLRPRLAEAKVLLENVSGASEKQRLEEGIAELEAELAAAEEEREKLRAALAQALGLNPEEVETGPEAAEALTWEEELEQLLEPAFSELSELTRKPREQARMDRRQATLQQQLQQVVEAQRRTEVEIEAGPNPATRAELEALLVEYQDLEADLRAELEVVAAAIDALETDEGAWSERKGQWLGGAREGIRSFFADRGEHLLKALGVFVLIFLAVRLFQGGLRSLAARQREEKWAVFYRLLDLFVLVLGVVAAGVAMLSVLYMSGDWLLLTVAVAVLIALGWSARNGIPRFWREAQLMINIGPVRQGERILWEGLPWRVQSLHLLTILENPAFPDTRLRVPLSAMLETTSRPVGEDESWFPTVKGDWIVWDDGAARVLKQSPEFVVLRRDNSDVTVPTEEFVGSSVVNLSSGFRHRVTVTFDYRHQDIVTSLIPDLLRQHVEAALQVDPYGRYLTDLGVDFEAASASSLDVEIEADFDGRAADRWEALIEVIQGACVDACNAEGWEIALPQLTLHQAAPSSPDTRPDPPARGGRLVRPRDVRS